MILVLYNCCCCILWKLMKHAGCARRCGDKGTRCLVARGCQANGTRGHAHPRRQTRLGSGESLLWDCPHSIFLFFYSLSLSLSSRLHEYFLINATVTFNQIIGGGGGVIDMWLVYLLCISFNFEFDLYQINLPMRESTREFREIERLPPEWQELQLYTLTSLCKIFMHIQTTKSIISPARQSNSL